MFLPAVSYYEPGYSQGIVIADLNRDGHPDVVLVDEGGLTGDGSVYVLLGNGDGTLQAPSSYSSGGNAAWSIAVGDVNGDGYPDVVVTNLCESSPNCDNGSLDVLLNNGDGTLQAPISYNSGGFYAESVALADVNSDGHPDLIVTNLCPNSSTCGNGTVGVLLNRGDGTFQPVLLYNTVPDSDSVAVADVNGDGHPDLLVTNLCQTNPECDAGAVNVLIGNGNGTFQAPLTYALGGGYGFSYIAAADLNGNGHPDLIVSSECQSLSDCNNGGISVMLGNGDGTFQTPVSYSSGGSGAGSFSVADLNGDGRPDLVVADNCNIPCTESVVGLLLGNGDGTFQSPVTYASGGYETGSVAVADLNGDGLPDLITANPGSSDHLHVGVLLHVGTLSTTTALTSSLNPAIFGQTVTLTATVSSKSGTPTGTVVFYEGATTLGSATLANGRADISPYLWVASHSITAEYQGSVKFNSSLSSPLVQVVNMASTTTSIAASRKTVPLNKRVTYTAKVTGQYGGSAGGTVTFLDGGVAVATVSLGNNQAVYATSYQTRGTHVITASFSGDSNFSGSVSPPLMEKAKGAPSKTAVTTSGSPSQLGQPVTFTAKVTSDKGPIPDAEIVTFSDGKTILGSVELTGGIAAYTTSTLAAGKHVITAAYPGDTKFEPSTGKVKQVVK